MQLNTTLPFPLFARGRESEKKKERCPSLRLVEIQNHRATEFNYLPFSTIHRSIRGWKNWSEWSWAAWSKITIASFDFFNNSVPWIWYQLAIFFEKILSLSNMFASWMLWISKHRYSRFLFQQKKTRSLRGIWRKVRIHARFFTVFKARIKDNEGAKEKKLDIREPLQNENLDEPHGHRFRSKLVTYSHRKQACTLSKPSASIPCNLIISQYIVDGWIRARHKYSRWNSSGNFLNFISTNGWRMVRVP